MNTLTLLTPERAEKFDLLAQLILNQREAIVLSGDSGIGKTTFLHTLQRARADIWAICVLQATPNLRFSQIQQQLAQTILHYSPELIPQSLSALLMIYQQRRQKIVLAFDDSYYLSPGLMTLLIEYALQHPIIRLIFVLTKEELYLKYLNDRDLDNCYFLEIPLLNKSQTALFLQQPPILYSKKCSSSFIIALQQRSGGIPAKIQTELPILLTQRKKTQRNLAILLSFLLIIVLFKPILQTAFNFLPSQHLTPPVQFVNSAKKTLPTPNSISPQFADKLLQSSPIKPLITSLETPHPILQSREIAVETSEKSITDDNSWLLQQPATHYTLQLSAFSRRESLLKIIHQYQALQNVLKIIHTRKNYILLYGSFNTSDAAKKAMLKLPLEFRHAWLRRFNILQTEINPP